MAVETIMHDGRERVVMDKQAYEDLIDARDHAEIMRKIDAGEMATIPEADVDAYLASPTPLAFWRRKRGFTQVSLAAACGISQAFVAQIERGQRTGDVATLAKLARTLGLAIEDLLVDAA